MKLKWLDFFLSAFPTGITNIEEGKDIANNEQVQEKLGDFGRRRLDDEVDGACVMSADVPVAGDVPSEFIRPSAPDLSPLLGVFKLNRINKPIKNREFDLLLMSLKYWD